MFINKYIGSFVGSILSKNKNKKKLYYSNLESRVFPKTKADFKIIYTKSLLNNNYESYKSEIPITFRSIKFGENILQVLKIFPKPTAIFEYKYENTFEHKVLFYKEKFALIKFYKQIHFINNQFVYASYIFRERNYNNILLLTQKLINKYLGHQNPNVKLPITIFDDANNKINAYCNFYLTFEYISNSPLIEKIATYNDKNFITNEDKLNKIL